MDDCRESFERWAREWNYQTQRDERYKDRYESAVTR